MHAGSQPQAPIACSATAIQRAPLQHSLPVTIEAGWHSKLWQADLVCRAAAWLRPLITVFPKPELAVAGKHRRVEALTPPHDRSGVALKLGQGRALHNKRHEHRVLVHYNGPTTREPPDDFYARSPGICSMHELV
jgi:hypothetical protein